MVKGRRGGPAWPGPFLSNNRVFFFSREKRSGRISKIIVNFQISRPFSTKNPWIYGRKREYSCKFVRFHPLRKKPLGAKNPELDTVQVVGLHNVWENCIYLGVQQLGGPIVVAIPGLCNSHQSRVRPYIVRS